jgi:hypothetical protein
VDRRTRNLFALVLVVVVAITGGAALLLSDTRRLDPDEVDGGTYMVGVIVGVEAQNITDVRGFQLRRADGVVVEFRLGELENADQFPPGHLAEHQATAQPVRVYYRQEGDERFAVRLEDEGG